MYQLIALARDIYVHSQTSTSTVTIHVLDVNDNYPTWIYPPVDNGVVSLPYRPPRGSHAFRVQASDADRGENAELVFSLRADDDVSEGRLKLFILTI